MPTTQDLLFEKFQELDQEQDFPVDDITNKVAYISTPRCGSTMFCSILANTGLLGNPMEWINTPYMAAYAKYFAKPRVDFKEYLDFVLRKSTSANGIFGINFHVSQYVTLLKNKVDIIKLGFDKIYYLSRRDKIAQAHSLAKASLTDQWSSTTSPKNEVDVIPPSQCIKALAHIVEQEEFYANNLQQLVSREFVYEDFKNVEQTTAFADVLADLGVGDDDVQFEVGTKKQSAGGDRQKVEELRQYLAAIA